MNKIEDIYNIFIYLNNINNNDKLIINLNLFII